MQAELNVYLEITNKCNRHCPFCPGTRRAAGFLDVATFRRRLGQIKPFARCVYLHLLGEPLLHGDLPQMLEIAATEGVDIKITTNGDLLPGVNGAALLNATAVRQINFSLHALEEHSEWDKLQRILEFSRAAADNRYINLRLWNGGEAAEFNAETLRRIGDFFAVPELKMPEHRRSKMICRNIYLNFDRRFVWPSMDAPAVNPAGTCHGLNKQIGILLDGRVVICCLDAEGETSLGNIDREELSCILSSAAAQKVRENWRRNTAATGLCRHCSFRQRFDGKKQ